MIISTAVAQLRLRSGPILDRANILGDIRQGATVYTRGTPVVTKQIKWVNTLAPCMDGLWREGWAANSDAGAPLLVSYEINHDFGSPVEQPTRITQMFGENPQFYGGAPMWYAGHNGIDLGTFEGTPIYAVGPGRVTRSYMDSAGYGHCVRIDHHNGQISLYAHLNARYVNEGDQVVQGFKIGLSGNTGLSSGPHLHFEMRVPPINETNGYGGRVDPLAYIDRSKLIWPAYVSNAQEFFR